VAPVPEGTTRAGVGLSARRPIRSEGTCKRCRRESGSARHDRARPAASKNRAKEEPPKAPAWPKGHGASDQAKRIKLESVSPRDGR